LLILEACRTTEYEKIVITHGTDTMVDTAAFIATANLPKTIVLTGAMIPYTFGTSSDGFFNLGSALGFAQCQESGVYIVMNGRCFDWANVKKNYTTGYFEALSY
jgi:L-asparaginase